MFKKSRLAVYKSSVSPSFYELVELLPDRYPTANWDENRRWIKTRVLTGLSKGLVKHYMKDQLTRPTRELIDFIRTKDRALRRSDSTSLLFSAIDIAPEKARGHIVRASGEKIALTSFNVSERLLKRRSIDE